MHTGIRWFDRFREKLRERREAALGALPELADTMAAEAEQDLERAEVLLIARDVAERMVDSGDAPEDLRHTFGLPFEVVFFQFDGAVRLPGERGEGLRGILVSGVDGRYRARAWFEERRATTAPRYDFAFAPKEALEGGQKRIANLLYWLSGYVNAPNVLAMRHNRRHEVVRRYRQAGRPAPASYYTFAGAEERRRPRRRRMPGEPKPRMTIVHGHFRRAHWHRLPSGLGRAWYPTTWVRSHRRRIPEPAGETKAAA